MIATNFCYNLRSLKFKMHNNISIILLRSGSKEIKNKNIKLLNNKPLFYYATNSALKSNYIKNVIISSDSDYYLKKIRKFFKSRKLILHKRSKKNSRSESSSENALIEVFKFFDIRNDLCFFIQATSPLIKKEDLENAFKKFKKEKKDSLFSGYEDFSFIWKKTNSNFKSINYNYKSRPRRQKFQSNIIENGAFYIFKIKKFLKYKNRLFDKIGFYRMPKYRSFEIDEKHDWKFIKNIIN